jgi:mannose-6-phosphate isomerase-like protein (cupin superfamily)
LVAADSNSLRYLLDTYRDWAAGEGVPVKEVVSIDLNAVETAPWRRLGGGCGAAFVHLRGRGDFIALQVIEIPASAHTDRQRHLYDEIFHVLSGHGCAEIEVGKHTHRLDFGPRAVFSPPLNASWRLFNNATDGPLRLVCANSLPFAMNVFRKEQFLFDNPYLARGPAAEAFSSKIETLPIEQGRFVLKTGSVPDVAALALPEWTARGAGSRNAEIELSESSMHVHASEIPGGTYNKGRVAAGPHVIMVAGTGYTLCWKPSDAEFERHDWKPGVAFVAPDDMFHQHFNTGVMPSRHLALSFGSYRHPVLTRLALRHTMPARSTREGGPQVDFEDQDPRIHALWHAELAKTGTASRMAQDATAGAGVQA